MNFFSKINLSAEYSAMDITNYFLQRGIDKNYQLSNLQVQKILYFIQRHFLQKDNRALFYDDFEAWQFGPVIRKVYNNFCGFGAMSIYYIPDQIPELSSLEKKKIDRIVDEKRCLPVWELVNDTHAKNKAWDLVYQDGMGYTKIIPKELIAYYS